MSDAGPDLDNAFWRFSLAVYAAPGVEAECLALQAAHAIDVNLLLFAAWAGAARGWRLEPADLDRLRSTARELQEHVIQPLRSARRAAKELGGSGDPALTNLKAAIARCELAAEQIEQALLFAQAPATSGPVDGAPEIVRENVALILNCPVSEPAVPVTLPEALMAAALAAGAAGGP